MYTGLEQSPIIKPEVPLLVSLWTSGFTACRAAVIYAVESGMGPDEFLAVAEAQIPLARLIGQEYIHFQRLGWSVMSDRLRTRTFDQRDLDWLSRFGHDVYPIEGMIEERVNLARVDRDELYEWFEEAQHCFRLRPSLPQIIRGLKYYFLGELAEQDISFFSNVEGTLRFVDDVTYARARSVFRNLVSNGIKYGVRDGKFFVTYELVNDLREFAKMWDRNISAQGFVEAI